MGALGAEVLTVDVALPASVSGLAWQLDGEKIGLALYVAGVIRRPGALTPPTQEDFDAVMHTNVLGAMQALPQVAPLVSEARGVFAFLSSSMSLIGSVPQQRVVAVPHEQGRAEHGRGGRAARLSPGDARHAGPGLGAYGHGWGGRRAGGAESVERMRAVLGSVTPGDRGRLLHHDGRRAMQW